MQEQTFKEDHKGEEQEQRKGRATGHTPQEYRGDGSHSNVHRKISKMGKTQQKQTYLENATVKPNTVQ